MRYHEVFRQIPEQLSRIADGINSPWTIMPTLLLILTTVLVAIMGLEEVRALIFRPRIRQKELELVKTKQKNGKGDELIYHRLIVKNLKWSDWQLGRSARDVRVLLTYEKLPNSQFIPIPLRWTYWGKSSRDISRNEPAYLDVICQIVRSGVGVYEFCWPDDMYKPPSDSLLREFKEEYGNLRLQFYERAGGLVGDIRLRYISDKESFEVIQ